MKKGEVYMNRELSWLKFNERVLEEAESENVPLCERLSFISIYQSNLDEFFMVRVGSLIDQMMLSPKGKDNKTQMTPEEQIREILKRTSALNRRRDAAYETLMDKISEYGVKIVDFHKISRKMSESLEQYFDEAVAPLIAPTMVGKKQPFPFLKNREIYAVAVLQGKSGKEKLGIIPCTSSVFPRLIPLPDEAGTYMLSEELILHYIPKVFKGYFVKAKSLLRVTRNADIDPDSMSDEDLDYREFMTNLIKKRKRLSPVRLELSRELDGDIVDTLCNYLDVDKDYVYRNETPLELSFVFRIQDMLRNMPELFYKKRIPQKPAWYQSGKSVLAQIRQKDRLLSYPYESIRPFLDMLQEAANDEQVIAIKMTLYRVARQSKVVETLIEAAENGKDVLVLVELKARFDEENNIEWSRRLEEAGCQVIYGLDGYKVHSKMCLIIRKNDENHAEYYTQIGTGNYNEKTSRLYTDLSLMTHEQKIGQEAAAVFQALSKGETADKTENLLVAPKCLQSRILSMIEEETDEAKKGNEAYIGIKINSLTDRKIIDKLIEASCAGVQIDLIVRGICCLVPGVAKKTEHIRVISIVGRFLEHSRIYLFGTGEREKFYIASADFMTRNTVHRVEVAAPIHDPQLAARIKEMFWIMLRDNCQARLLGEDGNYVRIINDEETVNAQEYFYEEAYRPHQSFENEKEGEEH